MRISAIVVIAYAICGFATASEIQKIICAPDDPSDCYPQVFVPTDEWQIIREGQDIPAGLHVRLNIETLQREAKLMDPSDEEGSNAIVVVDNDESMNDESINTEIGNDEKIRDLNSQAINGKMSNDKPKKATTEEFNEFNESLEQLSKAKNEYDISTVEDTLENLSDLAHDIDFGIQLASNPSFLEDLHVIMAKGEFGPKTQCYILLGNVFRNNPEAVKQFMSNANSRKWIKQWIIDLNEDEHFVKVRVMSPLTGLLLSNEFKYEFLNQYKLLDDLVKLYPEPYESTKAKIICFFEDLKLVKDTDQKVKELMETGNYDVYIVFDKQMSEYLQNKLTSFDFESEDQFKLYYNTLVELHKDNSHLKGSKEFVAWLDEESGKRANGLKERDELYSDTDKTFDKNMLETRHVVFGNPNALRKHFDDEL